MPDPSLPESPYASPGLAKSVSWLLFGKLVAFAFSFIVPLFLVRHMSQHDFGLYKQAFLAINTVVAVFPLGFVMSAFYFLPRESSRRGPVVFNIVLFYIFIGVLASLVLVLRPGLLGAVFNAPDLVEYGPLIGAVILVWVLSSFFEFVAVANGEARLAALFVGMGYLVRSLLLVCAAMVFTSLRALLVAAFAHGVLLAGASLFFLHRRFPGFWRRFDKSLMRTQLAYAMPLGVVGILYYLQTDLHHYVVSNQFGPAIYAIYAVGCFELPLLAEFMESIQSVVIARVSALRHENNRRAILLLIAKMFRTLAVASFPVYLFFLVTGREFISFLFTDQYLGSWPVFAINLTLIPFSLLSIATDPLFRAYPEHRFFMLATRVAMSVLLLMGLWFGTKHFLWVGAVSAVVAVHVIEHLIFGAKATRILQLSWRDLALFKDVGKVALASAMAAAVTALVREPLLALGPFAVLAICSAVFALVYLGALVGLKVLTAEEMEMVQRVAAHFKWNELWKKAMQPYEKTL